MELLLNHWMNEMLSIGGGGPFALGEILYSRRLFWHPGSTVSSTGKQHRSQPNVVSMGD